jgi:DNA polymerase I-like protein with 3'-5' exonuclease and polymerase domains
MPKQLELPFMPGKFRERFQNVFVIDFEYANIGGSIIPTSVAIKNLATKDQATTFTMLRDEEGNPLENIICPWDTEATNLFIVWFAEAECSVFEELGWPQPEAIIDLYIEVRNFWNGVDKFKRFDLKSVAETLRIQHNYKEDDKSNLRERLGNDAIAWTCTEEMESIERYNIEDVEVTAKLYEWWEHAMDNLHVYQEAESHYWNQALTRGRVASIAAQMGRQGYPIDTDAWHKFLDKFPEILKEVLNAANNKTGCFPGGDKFNHKKFAELVTELNLFDYWPKTANGALMTDQETLRIYEDIPEIKIIKEALYLKNATKLSSLPLDFDGRAKAFLSFFKAKTGRAAPSTSMHILNFAQCFRPFIKSDEGYIVTIDFEQQEFLIGAVLSDDGNMIAAYDSGDPYLSLGIQARIIPEDGTKKHPKRGIFKTVCLMTQYGAGVEKICSNMKSSIEEAEMALQHHQRVFNKFWDWQEEHVDHILYKGEISLSDGWSFKLPKGQTFRPWGETKGYSVNTLKNWVVQSTGAQILRTALVDLAKEGIIPIGTMHDEIIFYFPKLIFEHLEGDKHIKKCSDIMIEAARKCGIPGMRTEINIINPGERFPTKDEADMELFKLFAKGAGFDSE